MFLRKHLSAFKIYIFLLVISLSILISGLSDFYIINFVPYLFIHLLLIYIAIYHFRTIYYLIFFVIGIILDIFIINEIGPHIIVFMLSVPLLKRSRKLISTLSPLKIFFLIVIFLIIALIFEIILSILLFNIHQPINYLLNSIFVAFLISYPVFYFFNKIDRLG